MTPELTELWNLEVWRTIWQLVLFGGLLMVSIAMCFLGTKGDAVLAFIWGLLLGLCAIVLIAHQTDHIVKLYIAPQTTIQKIEEGRKK